MTTLRNLHGQEVNTIENDLMMGERFLGAHRLNNGQYIYYAPETGYNYLVSDTAVIELGRVVWAIAKQSYICPRESLNKEEVKAYSDPDDDNCLCGYDYAYSIWCDRTHAKQTDKEIPELVFLSDT